MDMTPVKGHSADVELNLLVSGARLPLSHVGPEMVIFRQPQLLPPATEAELIVKIDNFETREAVVLYEGATLNSKQVNFRRQSPSADGVECRTRSDHASH